MREPSAVHGQSGVVKIFFFFCQKDLNDVWPQGFRIQQEQGPVMTVQDGAGVNPERGEVWQAAELVQVCYSNLT